MSLTGVRKNEIRVTRDYRKHTNCSLPEEKGGTTRSLNCNRVEKLYLYSISYSWSNRKDPNISGADNNRLVKKKKTEQNRNNRNRTKNREMIEIPSISPEIFREKCSEMSKTVSLLPNCEPFNRKFRTFRERNQLARLSSFPEHSGKTEKHPNFCYKFWSLF